jgi:mRNA deadenylase 3'-5' endonuclease subunit Ccr4
MYLPPLSHDQSAFSSWDHRKSLLRECIGLIDADVVCLQEVSPLSFEDDFAFMIEDLGYDGVELFKKGRFRPATFWKKDRVALVGTPHHKDRTLLTSFRLIDETTKVIKEDNWHVLNCHLQAGKQGGRRVRQIIEGTNAAIKTAKKIMLKGKLLMFYNY